jgi:hypothetical protein
MFKGVSLFVDFLHVALTGLFAFILIPLANDVGVGLVMTAVSYVLASFTRYPVKKLLVKKMVLFDIHGVYITGDFNIEKLYEVQGTKELIQRLRKKYKVVALTNMGPEMFGLWAGKWGFSHVYDDVYYSGQFKIKKPDARIFQIILKKTNSTPQSTVFLDDTAENVNAARKLGMHGIVFKDAKGAEAELTKMGFGP